MHNLGFEKDYFQSVCVLHGNSEFNVEYKITVRKKFFKNNFMTLKKFAEIAYPEKKYSNT